MVHLGKIYEANIRVNRGKIHDYLGIDFDSSQKGVMRLSMMNNIAKIFRDFPEEIGKLCATPASDHIFMIRDPEETKPLGMYLPEEMAQQFHHRVAQLLFIATRVRRDIQTAVAFLTTCVKAG